LSSLVPFQNSSSLAVHDEKPKKNPPVRARQNIFILGQMGKKRGFYGEMEVWRDGIFEDWSVGVLENWKKGGAGRRAHV
jgi:hypothetical protein